MRAAAEPEPPGEIAAGPQASLAPLPGRSLKFPPPAEADGTDRGASQLARFWARFRTNRLAVAGLVIVVLMVVLALLADVATPYDRDTIALRNRSQPPSSQHWMGTDALGRDVLTRTVYGARVSLQVGLAAMGLSVAIGVAIGATAAYYGGLADNLLMRLTDVFLSIPFLYLAVTAVALWKPGIGVVIVTLGLTTWPSMARLVRGELLGLRSRDFVQAAEATGASGRRIIVRHLLPNAMAPIIVSATLRVAGAILAEAALSYLGIGIQPPVPSWGNMLLEGQGQILRGAWWLAVFPGAAIFVAVMAFNAFGDGLREALDPRLR